MKFYHTTTSTAVESIRKDGVIKAGVMGDVFLCRKPLDACKFLILRGMPVIYVVEVDLRRSDVVESHDHAESFFGCKAYVHRGDIPLHGLTPVRAYDFHKLLEGEE